MADETSQPATKADAKNNDWHTWASGLVNIIVVTVIGAVVTAVTTYFGTHPVPPIIPPPVIVTPPADTKPAPTDEQIQKWIADYLRQQSEKAKK